MALYTTADTKQLPRRGQSVLDLQLQFFSGGRLLLSVLFSELSLCDFIIEFIFFIQL